MVNEISSASGIGQVQGMVTELAPELVGSGRFLPAGERTPSAHGDESDATSSIRAKYSDAVAAKEGAFEQALEIRQVLKSVDEIGGVLSTVQDALGGIVKRYPPYLPDSPERVDLLNQVTGLRKQIEALSVPAEVSKRVPDLVPLIAKLIGIEWQLAEDVSDAELGMFFSQAETAAGQLKEVPSGMWADLFSGDGQSDEKAVIAQSLDAKNAVAHTDSSISSSSEVLSRLS